VGNLGELPAFRALFQSLLAGRELLCSVAVSQVISNVPAALLLSGFTDNAKALLIGTNLGGLGTLIASMASLISYKYYAQAEGARKGKYMIHFTIWNIIFAVILLVLNRCIPYIPEINLPDLWFLN
jgi:Na+/H+ antiporter NhaD/arsenite permease-like protein